MKVRGRETNIEGRIGVFDIQNLKHVDWILVALTLALALIGLLTLYSATYGDSSSLDVDNGAHSFLGNIKEFLDGWFGKQLLFFFCGLFLAILLICFDYRFLVALGPVVYAVFVILLVLVLFIGVEVKGAKRWFDLGFTGLQPSEFTKVALVYMLAWYLSRIGPNISRLFFFLLALAFAGIPFILIFLEPSLSAALILGPVALVMVFVAGCRWWHLGILFLPAILPALFVYMQLNEYRGLIESMGQEEGSKAYMDKEYPLGLKLTNKQLDRILMFREPERDPLSKGYHAIQARITVGSGQFVGKGFCNGTQTHMSFLPEFHNDYIFALLAEEWGFVGATTVTVLFLLFFLRALSVAQSCPDTAGSMLAVGSTTILATHAFINIGITVGLLPVTGMPLPFLSYGGSFYFTTMLCVGTLMSVYVRRRFFE